MLSGSSHCGTSQQLDALDARRKRKHHTAERLFLCTAKSGLAVKRLVIWNSNKLTVLAILIRGQVHGQVPGRPWRALGLHGSGTPVFGERVRGPLGCFKVFKKQEETVKNGIAESQNRRIAESLDYLRQE